MNTSQNKSPLIIGVVGHTNTGKTSLVRTLLRHSEFGEVANSAGTTRHVEAANLSLNGRVMMELRDTPGLEDSVALADLLDKIAAQGHQGRQCLQYLIDHTEKHAEFEQEIKVLRQALQCDAMFYVVDCRDDVLEKYRQEIFALGLAARPILPVLNFVNSADAQPELWRQSMADLRLHAMVEFDTVAFDFNAEKRLYQKLQSLLESRYDQLQSILDQRQLDWQKLREACVRQVARLLADVAAMGVSVDAPRVQAGVPAAAAQTLRDSVRQREQDCLSAILEIMQFKKLELELAELPVLNGHWSTDLFSPDTLKLFGRDTASAAATGAAIGAGIDLMLAGLSLGTAAATGAVLGTAWNTGRRYGRDLLARFSGRVRMGVDPSTLEMLTLRQLLLLQTLFRRGHAASDAVHLAPDPQSIALPAGWPAQLARLRLLQSSPEIHREERLELAITSIESWLLQNLV